MGEKNRPEENAEGHKWKLKPEGTEDVEGQRRGVSAEGGEKDDTEGQALRPPPDHLHPNIPMIEEDDTEGQGMVGLPRPPVD